MPVPPVFDAMAARAAIEANRTSGSLLVVDATATWCQPCKIMDRVTWSDPGVEAWMRKHAAAVKLDVEQDRELSEQLRIRTIPCVIAFKDGHEFDRITGMREAAALLRWLGDVVIGRTEAARLRDAVTGPGAVGARYDLAQHLAEIGRHDDATEEFAWLWEHMLEHDPSMVGVRASFFARQVKVLAFAHAAARRRFTAFRDALDDDVRAPSCSERQLSDWLILNSILGEDGHTLAWFDGVKHDPAWTTHLDREEHRLAPLLLEKGRWADVGMLYADPMAQLRQRRDLMASASRLQVASEMRASMQHVATTMFRTSVAQLHAALLAAGREEDARRLADELRIIDDSTEMAAVLEDMRNAAQAGRGVKRL